jgi:hypothetical protein
MREVQGCAGYKEEKIRLREAGSGKATGKKNKPQGLKPGSLAVVEPGLNWLRKKAFARRIDSFCIGRG